MDPAPFKGRHRLQLEHLAGLLDPCRGPVREVAELALAPTPVVLHVDEDAGPLAHPPRQHQVDQVLERRQAFALSADERTERLMAVLVANDVEPARVARLDLDADVEAEVAHQLLEDLLAGLEGLGRGLGRFEIGAFGSQRAAGGRQDRRDRGPRRYDGDRDARRGPADLTAGEEAEVTALRGSVASERAELEAAEASPEALAAGKVILEQLLAHIGYEARVEVETGETSRLNVQGEGREREELGALIGRKGERLSALQHLVNLMLSRQMGTWTRVLVDVEDYRGRRERQLREIAERAARRVVETGKMLQLEPMPALERRWVHLALKSNPDVATQSIGEEPNRRIVVVPRA